HLRWAVNSQPWQLPFCGDMTLSTPRTGCGALIYYLGYSEPETARFITTFLRPGMTFWDVGAHIGEYSLLGGRCVGASGTVEAVEPNPRTFPFLMRNVKANGLFHISLHAAAMSDRTGTAQFALNREPAISSLTPTRGMIEQVPVRVSTLDMLHKAS